jgi:diacylglycerol kinase
MSLPDKVVKYHPIKSVGYAIEGIRIAFSREKNLFLQVLIGIGFACLGIWRGHWVLAMANLILMGIVISLEMINTAFETLCDLVHPGHNLQVKIIKDMAAGSVLVTALVWLVVILYEIIAIFILKLHDPIF